MVGRYPLAGCGNNLGGKIRRVELGEYKRIIYKSIGKRKLIGCETRRDSKMIRRF